MYICKEKLVCSEVGNEDDGRQLVFQKYMTAAFMSLVLNNDIYKNILGIHTKTYWAYIQKHTGHTVHTKPYWTHIQKHTGHTYKTVLGIHTKTYWAYSTYKNILGIQYIQNHTGHTYKKYIVKYCHHLRQKVHVDLSTYLSIVRAVKSQKLYREEKSLHSCLHVGLRFV